MGVATRAISGAALGARPTQVRSVLICRAVKFYACSVDERMVANDPERIAGGEGAHFAAAIGVKLP